MKILITGASGFLGTSLIPELLNDGHQVVAVSRNSLQLEEKDKKRVRIIQASFTEVEKLANDISQVDWVVHLACTTVPENATKNPVYDMETNVIPTLRFLSFLADHKIKNILFASSGGVVYGNSDMEIIEEEEKLKPVSSYGISKMIIENNIRLLSKPLNYNYCILRIANIYGIGYQNKNNQGVINMWVDKISTGQEIMVLDKIRGIRDYIYVTDVVNAIRKAMHIKAEGTYNIGTGVGTSLVDLIELIEKKVGKKAIRKIIADRKFDVDKNVLSFRKFNQLTGWSPAISLDQGIEKLVSAL